MYACRFFINSCTLKTTMRNFFLYLKMDKDKEKWYDWNKWGWSSLGGKYPRLWQSDINGLNTSEALFDPFTFAHAFGASLQFFLIPYQVWDYDTVWEYSFILNFAIHLLFELLENTPCIILLCRVVSPDKKYRGDSILNSIGDMISFVVFYWITWVVWYYAKFAAILIPIYSLNILLGFHLNFYFD